jgi:hypothetical protein
MNILLVLACAAVGGLTGLGVTMGWIPYGTETWVNVAAGLILALMLGLLAPGKFFLHGFLVGFLYEIAECAVILIAFDRYVASNPQVLEAFDKLPMSPKKFIVILAPIIGIVYGLILGLLTWLASKVTRRKPVETIA